MKSRMILAVVAGLLVGLAMPAGAQQQEQRQQPPMDPMMQEYLEKYATPGEHQKHLAMLAGTWTTTTKFSPAPGAPVQESTGMAENKMILGGRFLQTTHHGDFGGMPFEGTGVAGYDRYLNRYVETWVDNFGTMVLVSDGACDGTGKLRTVIARFVDPMTKKPTTMRSVYRVQDADHYVLEMYTQSGTDPEFKVMEIAHTRKK